MIIMKCSTGVLKNKQIIYLVARDVTLVFAGTCSVLVDVKAVRVERQAERYGWCANILNCNSNYVVNHSLRLRNRNEQYPVYVTKT